MTTLIPRQAAVVLGRRDVAYRNPCVRRQGSGCCPQVLWGRGIQAFFVLLFLQLFYTFKMITN